MYTFADFTNYDCMEKFHKYIVDKGGGTTMNSYPQKLGGYIGVACNGTSMTPLGHIENGWVLVRDDMTGNEGWVEAKDLRRIY